MREQHSVRGLQVAMDDALGVHVLQRPDDLLDGMANPSLAQLHLVVVRLLQQRRQVAALGEVHDDVQRVVGVEGLVDPDDVRVVQRLEHRDLAFDVLCISGELILVDHLHHALHAQTLVEHDEHLTEGALSQLWALEVLCSDVALGARQALVHEIRPSNPRCRGPRVQGLDPPDERVDPLGLLDAYGLLLRRLRLPRGAWHEDAEVGAPALEDAAAQVAPEDGEQRGREAPLVLEEPLHLAQLRGLPAEAQVQLLPERFRAVLRRDQHVQPMLEVRPRGRALDRRRGPRHRLARGPSAAGRL
mmetsp:Transcript_5930/g.16949  ORF Transcript_5930/g.16949 Transcript_5930/m.16949 type:complete len:302 (-) Transcript_5930:320-1225(-)